MKILSLTMLVACSTSEISGPQPPDEDSDALRQAISLIREAEGTTGSTAANYLIQAAKLLLAESEFERAGELVERIDRPAALPSSIKVSYALLQADLAISQNDRAAALRWLTGNLVRDLDADDAAAPELYSTLGDLHLENNSTAAAVAAYALAARTLNHPRSTQNIETLWHLLTALEKTELERLAEDANSYELRGWIELA
ncbi:MAG: penicillin-binding protein activator, partial [Pseudohongiellaceae bacterium]